MYREYVKRMNESQSASERKVIVDEMCRIFAFSQDKAYKVLKENGWDSGRKKRKDAGSSSVSEQTISAVAALIKNSLRKNGKQTMPVTVARSLLIQNGIDIPVNNSRLCELLRERGIQMTELKRPTSHHGMRTLYPNHCHMADPSLSLLYYSPKGKQKIVRDDEQYKNKNFLEGKKKCWRYVLVDHYSASICVRYYSAYGETAVNMYDFLLYAWGQKKNPVYTFHGLPEMLYWDKGSGNINNPTKAALEALRVKTETHEAGNPRSKGAVECANNIVETHFECLLKLEEVHSIEELNEAVERWCAAYNANLIQGFDSRLVRYGKKIGSRNELWQRIENSQLRELPDDEVCRLIFTTGIQAKQVKGDLTISVYHPKEKETLRYSVGDVPGISVGATINVQPILVSDKPLVLIMFEYESEIFRMEIEPIELDDAGFLLNSSIIGEEYKQNKETILEKKNKELEEIASKTDGVAFAEVSDGKGLKAHSLINPDSPFIRQSTGKKITVSGQTVVPEVVVITAVESAKRIKARLGYVPDGFIERMKAEYKNAVPVNEIDMLAEEYSKEELAQIG